MNILLIGSLKKTHRHMLPAVENKQQGLKALLKGPKAEIDGGALKRIGAIEKFN